jgi:hypothetical protein
MSASRRSLCFTCLHEGDCVRSEELGSVVVHCEQFETESARARPVVVADIEVAAMLLAGRAAETENARQMGLCVNCDDRNDCARPRPAGGVWHCEEYR